MLIYYYSLNRVPTGGYQNSSGERFEWGVRGKSKVNRPRIEENARKLHYNSIDKMRTYKIHARLFSIDAARHISSKLSTPLHHENIALKEAIKLQSMSYALSPAYQSPLDLPIADTDNALNPQIATEYRPRGISKSKLIEDEAACPRKVECQ